MSSRRAAIRRERKQREKVERNRSPKGELMRAKEQGKIDGRLLSVFISAVILHDDFGWGKGKILKLIENGNAESVRFDNPGVRMVMEHWANKVTDCINDLEIEKWILPQNATDAVYRCERSDFFITGMAVISTVLSSDFGFGSNRDKTGRLDRLIERSVKEYMLVLCKKKNIESYNTVIKNKIGINFK